MIYFFSSILSPSLRHTSRTNHRYSTPWERLWESTGDYWKVLFMEYCKFFPVFLISNSQFQISISTLFSLFYHYPDFSKNRVCTHCIYDQNRVLVPMELMVWLAGLSTVSLGYTVVLWIYNRCKLKKWVLKGFLKTGNEKIEKMKIFIKNYFRNFVFCASIGS